MPKISNIYQDKKSGKWHFVANLGYDEKGNRVRQWQRGFSTQKEAKTAYDEYMNNHSKTAIKTNSAMSYQEFYETYFTISGLWGNPHLTIGNLLCGYTLPISLRQS